MRKLRRSNLSEEAYVAVKAALLSARYSPGERVGVEELSRQLGVSRTPVWDALNRLEAQGMVEIIPRKGVYLLTFSPDKARELYVIREALESMATRLAAELLNERQIDALKKSLETQEACLDSENVDGYAMATITFHNCIVEATGNRTLERMLMSVYAQVQALRLRTLYLPLRLRASFAEHRGIFDALVRRDPSAAEEAARRHMRRTTADALNILAQTGDSS